MKSNKERYPEAWKFFEEHARNIEGCFDAGLGKYRIPRPDKDECLYADCPGMLFHKLKNIFYQVKFDSPSIYGRIQYIVQNLNH